MSMKIGDYRNRRRVNQISSEDLNGMMKSCRKKDRQKILKELKRRGISAET